MPGNRLSFRTTAVILATLPCGAPGGTGPDGEGTAMQILIVNGSMTPKHYGTSIARWLADVAARLDKPGVTTRIADLHTLDLPFFDEPELPRLHRYEHDHTRAWSAIVDAADAFVFVSPEYNHSYSALLKNALDYLYDEWNYKPAGLVSYGAGVSAGLLGAQHLRTVLSALKMLPIQDSVTIPFIEQHVVSGAFTPNEPLTLAATTMLSELVRIGTMFSVLLDAADAQRRTATLMNL